ncbi:MAG TPA: RAMP superfamily CRISPR-associated protein [Kofleriaceae bacterium]|nr:RAMP superfamily CRISPR-associated protein [Kofleriaceae bacterium]
MTAMRSRLMDPGGVRTVVARWTITADLILESATHLGGEVDAASMMLLRDAHTGGPLLPGTSLAGALRAHLGDVLGDYRSPEDARVARLFGHPRREDVGAQSPLIVFDSFGELPNQQPIEVRDGVQLVAARGTADEHKKYDLEVLPAGTRFPIRFDLIVANPDTEAELVSLLVEALSGLSADDIAFGARRSRGLGAVRAESWRARRYDLVSQDGWMSWLLSDPAAPLKKDSKSANDASAACASAFPEFAQQKLEDRRSRIIIDVEFASKSALLVRSAPAEPDAPDAVHLRSAGHSILPGTGTAGALRTRALRIARIVRTGQGDADRWVEAIFGPRVEGIPNRDALQAHASRLRVSESIIERSHRQRPSRIRIDRFTQGVTPGALFEEEVDHGGHACLRLELRAPQTGELGLLLLVLKDLLSGDLALGGTAAVGRGVFTGAATLHMQDGKKIHIQPDHPTDPVVDQAIQALWSSAPRNVHHELSGRL